MKHIVRVTQDIEVEVDESKFTPEFMAEFRDTFGPPTLRTVDDHIVNIARLFAHGLHSARRVQYGSAADNGIRVELVGQAQEIAS